MQTGPWCLRKPPSLIVDNLCKSKQAEISFTSVKICQLFKSFKSSWGKARCFLKWLPESDRGTVSCDWCSHPLEVNWVVFLLFSFNEDVLLDRCDLENETMSRSSSWLPVTLQDKFTLYTHSGFHPRLTRVEILFWCFTQTVWFIYSWITVWMLKWTIKIPHFNTLVASFPFSLP